MSGFTFFISASIEYLLPNKSSFLSLDSVIFLSTPFSPFSLDLIPILLSLWFAIFYSSAFSQTANVTAGCAPLQVDFTAPAGSSTYFWDFDNGASSNVQNPSNTFVTAGVYDVGFSETVGGPIVGTVTIEVFATPIPQFTTSTPLQGCSPLTIDLLVDVVLPPGVTVNSYTWTSGIGTGASTQNVSFTYPTPGTYTVTFGITTNSPSCDNTTTFTNIVGVTPFDFAN